MAAPFINGRFLTQRITGVQRFALETLLALDDLLSRSRPSGDASVVVLVPPGAAAIGLRSMRLRRVGPLKGHAWEQSTLPFATGRTPLLSFGPTGPVLKREQVVTIHDVAFRVTPAAYGRLFRGAYEALLPALVRRTPFVMTVSNFSKAEIVRHFGARPRSVRVTGEGWQHIERVRADPEVIHKHDLAPRGYLLAVGSLTPNKNFGVLARALSRLGRPVSFQVAVAGAVDRTVFGETDFARLGALKLLGYVSDGQLRSLYENAAALVFPSLYEGFGLPLLEAMATDCPVIASNAAAIPEVCGDAAAYFDPRSDAELAEVIRRVMSSPEDRERLIEKGRERLRYHSWQGSARAYLSMIEEWTGTLHASHAQPVGSGNPSS